MNGRNPRAKLLILFIISEVDGKWNVHRHAQDISPIAMGLASEQDAMDISLPLAEVDKPSQIVRMDRFGAQKVVATFP